MTYVIKIGVIFLINTILLVWCAVMSKKDGIDEPLDDKNWHIDFERLQNALKKFLGNKQEVIVGMLGKNNAVSNESIYEKGFCFITDRACYFIGKVWQKKFIFSWKSNIQHRIVNTEMKGIKIKTLFPWYGLIYLICTIFAFINAIHTEYRLYLFCKINSDDYFDFMYITILLLIIMIIYLVYGIVIIYAKRKTTVDLEFVNQIMRFQINQLGKREIKDFYKAVSKVQQSIMDSGPIRDTSPVVNKSSSGNKVEHLSELARLHEQGLINEEEYNKLKGEIINN